MGKKAYNKIAESTGLKAIGLNWGAITQLADYLADFDGKVQNALKKALMKVGLNDYWAGVASRIISDIFF